MSTRHELVTKSVMPNLVRLRNEKTMCFRPYICGGCVDGWRSTEPTVLGTSRAHTRKQIRALTTRRIARQLVRLFVSAYIKWSDGRPTINRNHDFCMYIWQKPQKSRNKKTQKNKYFFWKKATRNAQHVKNKYSLTPRGKARRKARNKKKGKNQVVFDGGPVAGPPRHNP